ncbi:MAG TPA: cation-translocating P-type ATPase [Steroidobacter sp.]
MQSERPTAQTGSASQALWHRHSTEETFELLQTSPAGLTHQEAARRREQFGPNEVEAAPGRSAARILLSQFTDLTIVILIGAAIISGMVGELIDTAVIVAIVILNGLIGFVQEMRSERAMAALRAMAAPTATVVRDGDRRTITAAELVPGDSVILESGAIVPADLRLVDVAGLRVNEAALTGESAPIDKSTGALAELDISMGDRTNIAHKGTIVTYGRALGIVIATGMRTEFGKIARLLQEAEAVRTPLQRRLETFGRWLTLLVLLICAIVLLTGLMRGESILPMFLTALSLAVAAIPEALPAVVTISLALGARKMLSRRALIRRLPAVETLGSLTFICSDKTGTLTANEMHIEQYYCDDTLSPSLGTTPPWQELLVAMAISHDATSDASGSLIGDPTEVAMLRAALDAGPQRPAVEASHPRIAELPFDSERKCMTTVHRQSDGRIFSMTKGAAEIVLQACVRRLTSSGEQPLDRARVMLIADEMAAAGQRVLAIATRNWPSTPGTTPAVLERDLTFVALLGMIDPPREEAQQAIATCKSAGIVPVMITGDHLLTARAIASRLGILREGELELHGSELAALSDEEFRERVARVRVYARVSPEQKLRIVTALQHRGEIVAMTGDGVNDAPALKRADIGVAMGITGTDVAREASGVVLLDDNFATIVRAVHEGRRIYDNLRRFIRYVLTTNSAEIWTIFLAPFLGMPVPLLPIQILWINLISDGLPGLALAAEPAERDVMQRPPRPPGESLFAGGLGAHALGFGLFMAGLVLALQAFYLHAAPAEWQTIVVTALCFTQLSHVMAIRSEHTSLFALGFASNPPLLGAVLLTIALQLAVIYVPALNELFDTTPLSMTQLSICVAAAALVFIGVEMEKWIRRRRQSPRSVA